MASGSNGAVSGGLFFDIDGLDSLLFDDSVDDEKLLVYED